MPLRAGTSGHLIRTIDVLKASWIVASKESEEPCRIRTHSRKEQVNDLVRGPRTPRLPPIQTQAIS